MIFQILASAPRFPMHGKAYIAPSTKVSEGYFPAADFGDFVADFAAFVFGLSGA